MIGCNLTVNKIISAWEAAAIWENACRVLLPGASRRMSAQRLLLQEPVRRLGASQRLRSRSSVSNDLIPSIPLPAGELRSDSQGTIV